MFKRFRISLMFKISIICLVSVIFSSFLMQYYANKTTEKAIEDTMGQTALTIINSIKSTIDAEKLDKLEKPEDMKSEYYLEIQKKLISLQELTGLKYIYIMKKTSDGKYIYIVDEPSYDGEEEKLIGDEEHDISEMMALSFEDQEGYEINFSEEWGHLVSAYTPIKNNSGETIGMLGADFDSTYMVSQLEKAKKDMKSTTALIALIGTILSIAFSYMILRSIKYLHKKIELAKQGDLTVKIQSKSRDEIGKLSEAFQAMIDSISSIIRSIRTNTDETVNTVHKLNSSIDESNETMRDIASIINEISYGATTQSENAENVSASMEKVFSEIHAIMENIDHVTQNSSVAINDTAAATKILNDSVTQITLVNNTVESTSVLMEQLQHKFEEILSFSDRVSAIASQTNLLSLNASIEAALAKEHGKGFAVVAGEIKKLAMQTSEDSKKIKEIVTGMQGEIISSCTAINNGTVQARDGVNYILQVQEFLKKLSSSNSNVDNSVKEVQHAIINIEHDSNYVLKNIMELSDISREFSGKTQHSAAATEEQLSIMEELRKTLYNVKDMVEELNSEVGIFKID